MLFTATVTSVSMTSLFYGADGKRKKKDAGCGLVDLWGPQSKYTCRVEIGGVYLPSQLERASQLCL
jgi:hypothetical protein